MKKYPFASMIMIPFAVVLTTAFVISQINLQKSDEITVFEKADATQQNNNIVEIEETPTSYTIGFDKGYKAFLEQNGRINLAPISKQYTVYAEQELDKKEVDRGYVDGYHRAAEAIYCPRNNQY